MKRPMVVAIDGPGGAGKSTVSRRLAQALGYRYVDTGAMYRIVAVLAAERDIALADEAALARLCDATRMEFIEVEGSLRTLADERDLTDAIRTPQAAQNASRYSTVPVVRDRLVARQREMGNVSVVMEGRDIGTVVFPDAPLKIFLDASPTERARRRAAELHGEVTQDQLQSMAKEIDERDQRDRTRAHSPLHAAVDAVRIDTSCKSADEVVTYLVELARERETALASAS